MTKRNFTATADYFARRAGKSPDGRRRLQLEMAAERYREMAKKMGQPVEYAAPALARSSAAGIPSRRRKLIDLFRHYGGPTETS